MQAKRAILIFVIKLYQPLYFKRFKSYFDKHFGPPYSLQFAINK